MIHINTMNQTVHVSISDVGVAALHLVVEGSMIVTGKEIAIGNENMITTVVYMIVMEDDAEGVRRDQGAGVGQGPCC